MDDKSFESVKRNLEGFEFEETFDMIVAIANGGIIPAALLNQKLNIEIQLLKLHFRNPSQQPEHPQPKLMEPILFEVKGKNILLVEDRIKTGASLEMARDLLLKNGAKSIKTFAVNGNADYCLYNESCFRFPWILTV
jgi:uncharacterized protein